MTTLHAERWRATPAKLLAAVAIVALAAAGYLFLSGYITVYSGEQDIRGRIVPQFAASKDAVIFPVPHEGTIGLIYFDRARSTARLIFERTASFSFPSFSADGERLLLVRRQKESRSRELLSCEVANWACRVLWQTEASIISPIELRTDTVLLSSSPLIKRFDGQSRYARHDFYLLESGSAPTKLTDFRLYELHSLNVADGKVFFAAHGPPLENPIIPKGDPLGKSESDVFALDFDLTKREIPSPSQVLRPLAPTRINGYSIGPSISSDGERIAFQNRRIVAGRSRYNLVISTVPGTTLRYIEASGIGFSRPVFVGRAIVAGQLFDDRYEVYEVNSDRGSPRTLYALKHGRSELKALGKIQISVK